jgi:hypothetical protein
MHQLCWFIRDEKKSLVIDYFVILYVWVDVCCLLDRGKELLSASKPVSMLVLIRILVLLKAKAVPLHAMKALGGRGGIASTHSRPRH